MFERGGSTVGTRLEVDLAELHLLLRDVPNELGLKKRTEEAAVQLEALSQMEVDMQAKLSAGKKPGAREVQKNIIAKAVLGL